MNTERFIDPLLRKYQQAPDYPFGNWASDPVSFYALINLWDDLFKAAAGQSATVFEASGDVEMDPESAIYDVTAVSLGRRIKVVPETDGGTFHFIARDGDAQEPFKSELAFATDISAARLSSAFEIIRAYLASPAQDAAEIARLDAACVADHAMNFGFEDYDPFANRR